MSPDAQFRSERPFTLPARYRLRRHIATGGMASVWCAEDLVLGRTVAIKVLAERFAHDQLAMRRFKREARAAARVSDHRHVVTVYDVGDLEPDGDTVVAAPGRAFIVMEHLAGGTVADAIHHDSVRRHEAMRWLREAASALDHAHQRGIVHRDIKPANFLLDRGRVLHVTDFGIARLTSEDTITSSDELFGTAAYLSPEQALGLEATSASDRYALAVAAFELLVGERPFSAVHFSAQARQHIEEPPPAASDRNRTLPPTVDEVLHVGLAKDPAARPQTAGALVSALHDALAQRPDATRPRPRRGPGGGATGGGRLPDPSAPAASTAAARRRETTTAARTSSDLRPPTARLSTATQRGGRRAVALGALAVTVLVLVGVTLAATRGPGSHRAARVAARPAARSATTPASRPTAAGHARAGARHTHTASSSTTVAASAAQLQTTGHQEMLDGNYASAIPTLQRAVSAAAAAPHSPTYAYALYDLGRSMVLSGDPSAAIPVLRKRLAIPNQTGTVRTLLDLALADTGRGQASASGGAAPTTSTTTTTAVPPTVPAAGQSTSGGSGGASIAPAAGAPQGQSIIHLITAAAG